MSTFTAFDQASGLMTYREGGLGGGTGLIHSQVNWDLNGNLTQRKDLKLIPNVTEDFFYDALNRFDYSQRTVGTGSPAINADVTLDAIGNILWKKGVGNYAYSPTQRGAVTQAGSNYFGYDANGNMIARNFKSISYTSYNLPAVINAPGGYSSTISYGAFRNRYKQIAIGPQGTETTIYVAGLLEKVTNGTGTHYRHYIAGGKGTAAIHSRTVGGSSTTVYLHRDHMGSPELITDSSGNALIRPSFAAYGERRDGSDWDGPIGSADLNTLAGISRRGFTGHEHLDSVGLIHMNGRVFEPIAGRFLSRDPFIDGVASSQGANGYAYVHNSPLTLVDPSGFNCNWPEGMSDEEAQAWMTRCDAEFESSGWGPVGEGQSRYCTLLGMGCPRDQLGQYVESFFAPVSPDVLAALAQYESMVAASDSRSGSRQGSGWIECGGSGQAGCGDYDPHEAMRAFKKAIARANAILAAEMWLAEQRLREAGTPARPRSTNIGRASVARLGGLGIGVAGVQGFGYLVQGEIGEAAHSFVDVGVLLFIEGGGVFLGPALAWGYTELGGSRTVVAGYQALGRQLYEGAAEANRYQWQIAQCGGFTCTN